MRGLVIALVLLFSASCYGQERYDSRIVSYERFGSSTSRWSTNPPRLYSGGTYVGELSADRYSPDSVSNPYGRYGSRYSSDSINNPYGRHGVYSAQPICVYPRW